MSVPIKPARSYADELLQRFRTQGDPPADHVIDSIAKTKGVGGIRQLMSWLINPTHVETDVAEQESIRHFFAEQNELPTWADWEKMKLGMAVFQQHARQIGLILGCFSLPYCYLGANGAQVLWLTERIKKDTARRLQETGDWLFGVSTRNEWETGKAIQRTLTVRLIHACARWFVQHSGRWQDDWGLPVNQEDMAGTNLAFSYIVLRGLRKLDTTLSEEQEEGFLHHFNVVGYLNGVAEELLPQNLRQAYLLDRAIVRRQFMPSDAGKGLTSALLDAIAQQPNSEKSTKTDRPETVRNLAAGEMRFFLGDQYADWLAIPPVPVEKRFVNVLNRLPIFSNSVYS